MDSKVRFVNDGDTSAAARALAEQNRADIAAGEVTMMQRRIRTFYTELNEVSFPETAPSWASDWVEWLLTGTVASDVADEVPAEAAETIGV